jgi:hypothetical protein
MDWTRLLFRIPPGSISSTSERNSRCGQRTPTSPPTVVKTNIAPSSWNSHRVGSSD